MLSKEFEEELKKSAKLVEEKIDLLLPKKFPDSSLVEAMRYSSLSAGKRIRPFLVLKSSEIFDVKTDFSLNIAVAIELIHCYSLIHDDLPAMDDDDFRRGKPTCHKKFNEATAILAGDALLTYAFEILADENNFDDKIKCQLIKAVSNASGFNGMVGGQMIDLEISNQKISQEKLLYLHQLKTGRLFLVCCQVAAILGKANEEEKNALENYGKDFGLLFQIKDDLLDFVLKNHKEKNKSIVDFIGEKDANKMLEEIAIRTKNHLKIFSEKANLLIELVNFVIDFKE
jgi:farnesyl diphosphate synthase